MKTYRIWICTYRSLRCGKAHFRVFRSGEAAEDFRLSLDPRTTPFIVDFIIDHSGQEVDPVDMSSAVRNMLYPVFYEPDDD